MGSRGVSGPIVLDPMCGVGTYLLALAWLVERRGFSAGAAAPRFPLPRIVGMDAEAQSVEQAALNARRSGAAWMPSFVMASSLALPIDNCSVDLIVVDPPWGHRHATHAYVKRYFLHWAREWVRVLRPGGVVLVVTICAKLFETQVVPQLRGGLVISESLHFDNKGFSQCRLYTLQKPLGSDAAVPNETRSQISGAAAAERPDLAQAPSEESNGSKPPESQPHIFGRVHAGSDPVKRHAGWGSGCHRATCLSTVAALLVTAGVFLKAHPAKWTRT